MALRRRDDTLACRVGGFVASIARTSSASVSRPMRVLATSARSVSSPRIGSHHVHANRSIDGAGRVRRTVSEL